MKSIIILLFVALFVTSCAEDKTFNINGKDVVVEPYGWMNTELRNDSINYGLCKQNLILDVIFSETIITPIFLTGVQLFEPKSKK
jgi:hypothetical protein